MVYHAPIHSSDLRMKISGPRFDAVAATFMNVARRCRCHPLPELASVIKISLGGFVPKLLRDGRKQRPQDFFHTVDGKEEDFPVSCCNPNLRVVRTARSTKGCSKYV